MIKKLNIFILIIAMFFMTGCGSKNKGYNLNEQTFFLVMTNIQYYPEQYINKDIEFDCFTYLLTDIDSNEYLCGVRKCSSEFGCTCGNDTIIGFILNYTQEIPAPKNQSTDTNDKTWIHLKGQLDSSEKQEIKIYGYTNGQIDYSVVETISMLSYNVESLEIINDFTNLKYYVTK